MSKIFLNRIAHAKREPFVFDVECYFIFERVCVYVYNSFHVLPNFFSSLFPFFSF